MKSFDEFMADALYGPNGFYTTGRGAGRHRDFITSPELGPLFATVFARALDAWWEELGRPDPFVVIEAGAGRDIMRPTIEAVAHAPLRYVSVDVDDPWPERVEVGVIIANELIDNVPFRIAERVDGAWREVLVDGDRFVFGEPVRGIDHIEVPDGARIPLHLDAIGWLGRAANSFTRGRICLVDYGAATTAEVAGRQWLRTYAEHGRGFDPLIDPGSRDITADVAFDQLHPDRLTTQADWLRAHGIDALVAEARATWTERAAIGDLEALKARSRVNEADALLDPDGLGGFLVAEWHLG